MKYDKNSDEIREMFQNTFSGIKATDVMKDRIKAKIHSDIPSENKKMIKFKSAYKIITVAACFLLILCIANFDSIRAGVIGIYEYFFRNVEQQYTENTKDYVININKKIELEDDFTAEVTQAIFLDNGMDLKLKICDDTGKYDLVGCEMHCEDNEQVYELQQEMFARLSDSYVASLVCYDKAENWRGLIGKEVSFEMNILYTENDSDDAVLEKKTTIQLTPKTIFYTKYCEAKDDEIYRDDFMQIQSIELKGWYMKVNYDISYEYDEDKGFPLISIMCDNKELLLLSSEGPSESEENSDGEVTTVTEPGSFYYQLPEQSDSVFHIKTVFYEYGKAMSDVTKLSEWKKVHIDWTVKEDSAE